MSIAKKNLTLCCRKVLTIIALYSIVLQVGISSDRIAGMAQSVERRIGSAEVTGPIPVASLTEKKAVILDKSRVTAFLVAGIRKKLPVAGSKEITKVEKDLIIWLDTCGIASTTIWGICNMLKTDEEIRELGRFSLDIPEEMYRNNPSEAEEQILAKALQITQNRKIE